MRSARHRLAAVLRARRAQEDLARGAVAKANAEVGRTVTEVLEGQAALSGHGAPQDGDPRAFLASVAAGQALARALDEAVGLARAAEVDAETSADLLRSATGNRKGVQKLVDRHAEARRRAQLAADQRATDELAAGRDGEKP